MPARLKRKSQGFVFMYNLNRVYTQNIILQVQMRHEIEIMNVKKTEWYSRLEITRMDEQLNSYTYAYLYLCTPIRTVQVNTRIK